MSAPSLAASVPVADLDCPFACEFGIRIGLCRLPAPFRSGKSRLCSVHADFNRKLGARVHRVWPEEVEVDLGLEKVDPFDTPRGES